MHFTVKARTSARRDANKAIYLHIEQYLSLKDGVVLIDRDETLTVDCMTDRRV